MPGAYKRRSDQKRGKEGKYTGWYRKADGTKGFFAGTTDKTKTLLMAQQKEAEEKLVREGIVDAKDQSAKVAARRPISDHVGDYRGFLLSKGDKLKHADHVAGTLRRLLERAEVKTTADLKPDVIQGTLQRLRDAGYSARTANHALSAARAFTRWLQMTSRIKEDPLRGLRSRFAEKADIRYLRRDLSLDELDRLLEVAASGPDYPPPRAGRRKDSRPPIAGPDRAMAYRIVMGTGFRASELRTLTPESFELGPEPTVTVEAAYTKNKKAAEQPIRRDLADRLRGWLEGKPPGVPVLDLPAKTSKMLHFDLAVAGIPKSGKVTREEKDGKVFRVVHDVVDFHALRASYITHLIEAGASIKTVQELARHSDPSLTLQRYAKTDDRRKRDAIESVGRPPRRPNDES